MVLYTLVHNNDTSCIFPAFKRLDIHCKDKIVQTTQRYDPFSDFNFISLFSWNIDDTTQFSFLNDNLIILLPDYITGKSAVSILGNNKVDETLKAILSLKKEIKLVPEIVIDSIKDKSKFIISEDPDNHDYIYNLEYLSYFSGSTYKGKRKRLNRILREHGDSIELSTIDTGGKNLSERILRIYDNWAADSLKDEIDVANERKALVRLLNHAKHFPELAISFMTKDSTDIGFSINERAHEKTATCHFQKTILENQNFDILLTNYVSKQMYQYGSSFINWEQDLGIPGLRSFKKSYNPARLLHKYRITSV